MDRPDCIRHWTELDAPDDQRYPGDSVAFPAGTGVCHAFMNATGADVRLLVVGEANKPENRIRYPLNEACEATRPDRWADWPQRNLGPRDGKPASHLSTQAADAEGATI